jgi:class 3 adenylate cyclase
LKKREVTKLFSNYVSKEVLVKKEKNLNKKIREKINVFILFSDIENFTNFSEKLSAEQVLNILEIYF